MNTHSPQTKWRSSKKCQLEVRNNFVNNFMKAFKDRYKFSFDEHCFSFVFYELFRELYLFNIGKKCFVENTATPPTYKQLLKQHNQIKKAKRINDKQAFNEIIDYQFIKKYFPKYFPHIVDFKVFVNKLIKEKRTELSIINRIYNFYQAETPKEIRRKVYFDRNKLIKHSKKLQEFKPFLVFSKQYKLVYLPLRTIPNQNSDYQRAAFKLLSNGIDITHTIKIDALKLREIDIDCAGSKSIIMTRKPSYIGSILRKVLADMIEHNPHLDLFKDYSPKKHKNKDGFEQVVQATNNITIKSKTVKDKIQFKIFYKHIDITGIISVKRCSFKVFDYDYYYEFPKERKSFYTKRIINQMKEDRLFYL